MKKRSLLLTALVGIIYLTTTSYVSGPFGSLGNRTGSPGSSGTCTGGGCHASGAGTTGTIEIRKKSEGMSGTPVTSYEAGEDYLVTLTGTNSSLPEFGFQMVALDGSNQAVGTFSNTPTGVKTVNSNKLVEHSTKLAKNGSGDYEVTVDWKAPATAGFPVTFYGIINAVDGTGTSNGDAVSSTISTALTDKTSVANVKNVTVFRAFPNPVQGVLTIDMNKAISGNYMINVYNTAGQVVATQVANINTSNYQSQINTGSWAAGLYFVQIAKDGEASTISVVKQ